MRQKKALINSIANILSFIIVFIPNLLLRKVFIHELGNSWLGLNSLYTNIISWLSVAELGVGTAIVYSLYKPYAENDQNKIKAYINFYRTFYIAIGLIILVIGISIIPFLKFFIGKDISFNIASMTFILFLLNSFISYLFSYKLCILNVAQEAYKITFGTMITKLVIIITQIFLLKLYPNFVVYVLVQLIINLIYFIAINSYVIRKYPWINTLNEKLELKEKNKLLKNVKAMFIHKIGYLIVFSTDNLVISRFIGLTMVGKYTNYLTIISAIQTLINNIFNGLTSSIGNLIAIESRERVYDIHKKILFMNFWIVSFIVILLYNTLNQFIVIWLGRENVLDKLTFIVILINLYFTLMRGSISRFQEGSGQYQQDKYAAFLEAIINLVTSLVLVNYLGLAGVFIGTLISNITVIFWTKPYVVYKYVFGMSVWKYYRDYFKYLGVGLITLFISILCCGWVKESYTFSSLVLNSIINSIVVNIIYIIVFCRTDEFKYYIDFIKKINTRKYKKVV